MIRKIQGLYWKLTLTILCLMWMSACSVSQSQLSKVQRQYQVEVSQARFDKLGNLYVLAKNNRIYQYGKNLNQEYFYADNTLGEITHLDVSNPLEILIYKADYGLLIQLDNTLSEIGRINLYDLGYQGITAAATALDGHLWVFDSQEYKLKKINESGRVLLETINLVDLNLQQLEPQYIQERNGKVLLQDPKMGLVLFDNLGQFIQLFPFNINQKVQFDGNRVTYYKDEFLHEYNLLSYEENKVKISEDKLASGIINVLTYSDFLFYIYPDGIDKSKK